MAADEIAAALQGDWKNLIKSRHFKKPKFGIFEKDIFKIAITGIFFWTTHHKDSARNKFKFSRQKIWPCVILLLNPTKLFLFLYKAICISNT